MLQIKYLTQGLATGYYHLTVSRLRSGLRLFMTVKFPENRSVNSMLKLQL